MPNATLGRAVEIRACAGSKGWNRVFKTIVVPTDGSTPSQKAADQAIGLAAAIGARIIAVHVYERFRRTDDPHAGSSQALLAEAYSQLREAEAEQIFTSLRVRARAAAVALDTVLVEGDETHSQIIAVANRMHADLICMASHGRRGFAGIVLGSETNKVLTNCRIPVLVIR
jgi:nucleotide-binding universal stress UspA family protein